MSYRDQQVAYAIERKAQSEEFERFQKAWLSQYTSYERKSLAAQGRATISAMVDEWEALRSIHE